MRSSRAGLLATCLAASGALAQQPTPAGITRRIAPQLDLRVPHQAGSPLCAAVSSPDPRLPGDAWCSTRAPAQPSASGGEGRPASLWSILASAALPGAGQAMLGSLRSVPYAAFELAAWWRYADHSGDARRLRNDYRDLAARVARAPFSTAEPPAVGSFDYYERMEHYAESGRYDVVPGGAIDPETDTLTYNGAVWLLARRTYWSDPSAAPDTNSAPWRESIAFYQRRAYDGSYRWSWTNAPAEFERYRALIHDSNESHRRAVQDIGLVLANHVLSTIDAYVTVRVRRTRTPLGEAFAVGVTLPLGHVFAH